MMHMLPHTRERDIAGSSLIWERGGRRILLEQVETNYRVRALVQMGVSGDVARTFTFSDGELGAVKLLAKRRRLITE